MAVVGTFDQQIADGQRFEFGKNWTRFLSVLNAERIAEAEKSVGAMLELDSLKGQTFLDVGNGSGLFSLAAVRLGASKIHSFDFDPHSVNCAKELRRRYGEGAAWTIEQGSVLDRKYLENLGQWDNVYSWGVLHHTGQMWEALENVVPLVSPGGKLFISIYNDQGTRSSRWRRVKQLYCSGLCGRALVLGFFIPYFVLIHAICDLRHLKNPLRTYRDYKKSRGMSLFHDWFDWLGGYPFEVATPDAIFDFYRKRGFTLARLITRQGYGCNEFVFIKKPN